MSVIHVFLDADPAAAGAIPTVGISSLPAIPAGDYNIGNVDIVTFPSGTLAGSTRTADYDSGAGTQTTHVVGLVVPASGGPVALPGDTTNGLDVDVTRITSTGATDDAAAAGAVFVGGALYQATHVVDDVDDGDVGRFRMSKRRALVYGKDWVNHRATSTNITAAGPLTVSTTRHGSATAIAGTDLEWTASSQTRYFRMPIALDGFSSCDLILTNLLGIDAKFSVYLWMTGSSWSSDQGVIWSRTMPSGGGISIIGTPPGEGNSGVSYCPALSKLKAAYLIIEVVPSAVVTSGTIQLVFSKGV